jgi:hypothetical protein
MEYSLIFPVPYHQQPLVFKFQKSIIETIMIGAAFFVDISVGVIFKLVTLTIKFFFWDLDGFHSVVQDIFQNIPVFFQVVLDIPHVVGRIGFELVVETITAIIITKFFVSPPANRFFAVAAILLFGIHKNMGLS